MSAVLITAVGRSNLACTALMRFSASSSVVTPARSSWVFMVCLSLDVVSPYREALTFDFDCRVGDRSALLCRILNPCPPPSVYSCLTNRSATGVAHRNCSTFVCCVVVFSGVLGVGEPDCRCLPVACKAPPVGTGPRAYPSGWPSVGKGLVCPLRSEERRVGKEWRGRGPAEPGQKGRAGRASGGEEGRGREAEGEGPRGRGATAA